MRTIWLSHILSEKTPLYGGEKDIQLTKLKSIDSGDSCNAGFVSMPLHAGTHVDAPKHFIDKGKSIEALSANQCIFNAPFIIDIRVPGDLLIQAEDISTFDFPADTDIVLFRTGFECYRGGEVYWRESPGLSPDLADILVEKMPGLKAVGMDFISISSLKHRDKGRLAHKNFLGRNILIIEDMKLEGLGSNPRLHQVIALPLRIEDGDGAPVTVIGLLDEAECFSPETSHKA